MKSRPNTKQLKSIAQQLKAKMPAAGATQALRLFNNPLAAIPAWARKDDPPIECRTSCAAGRQKNNMSTEIRPLE